MWCRLRRDRACSHKVVIEPVNFTNRPTQMLTTTMLRSAAITMLLTLLGTSACSGEDEKGSKTAATCSAICARQNELCGTSTSCSALCSSLSEIVTTTGCTAENQAGLDCLAEKDRCDSASTLCPATELDACVDAYCSSNPNASVCQ